MNKAGKLHNIQALRGIAAVLVMLSHLYMIDIKYSGDPILSDVFEMGMAGVDLFFVISGFIMVYITSTWTAVKPAGLINFLFSRITRIYPLYWLVSLALLGVYLVKPDIIFASSTFEPNILKSFLLWPDKAPPLLQVGWTLIHEMGFYIIFAIALLFKKRWLVPYLLIWGAIIISAQFINIIPANPVSLIAFHPLSLEFIGGALIACYYTRVDIGRTSALMILTIATIAGLILAFYFKVFPDPVMRVLSFGTVSLFILAGAVLAERKAIIFPKFIQLLGDWSYSLYLTHILTLSLLGRIWASFAREGKLDNLIALPCFCVIAIIVAAITYYMFERPMIRMSRKLKHQKP